MTPHRSAPQQPRHLLAADARRAGDAAGAVALAVESQHSCSQLGGLGAVGQVLHLAEALLGGVDLVGRKGPRQDVRGGNPFRVEALQSGRGTTAGSLSGR